MISFRFVPNLISQILIMFRFVSMYYVRFWWIWFCLTAFHFVSLCSISLQHVSFLFLFSLYNVWFCQFLWTSGTTFIDNGGSIVISKKNTLVIQWSMNDPIRWLHRVRDRVLEKPCHFFHMVNMKLPTKERKTVSSLKKNTITNCI